MKFISVVLLAGLLLSPSGSQANNDPLQKLRGLDSGDLLRVVADSLGPVSATFLKLSSDDLSLGRYPLPRKNQAQRQLNYKPANQLLEYRPLANDLFVKLEDVSLVYKRGTQAGTGAVYGSIVGAGILLIFTTTVSVTTDIRPDQTGIQLRGAALGGLMGAGLGALLGSIFPKWTKVYQR